MAELFDALTPGTLVRGGEYKIGEVLGRGGFGITYRARDLALQREVAIKEFFPMGARRDNLCIVAPREDGAGFELARAEFLEEARRLARFDHGGIVRVFGVWEEHGAAYLAMELLRGPTLGALVESMGPLNEARALKLLRQVAEALREVHGAGLMHGDVQPENIIVTGGEQEAAIGGREERAVLLDFGLAAPSSAVEGFQTVVLGAMRRVGTPNFAAPEQYGRAPRGAFTDIYALGATLWFALTGTAPPAATDRAAGDEMPSWDEVMAQSPVDGAGGLDAVLATRADGAGLMPGSNRKEARDAEASGASHSMAAPDEAAESAPLLPHAAPLLPHAAPLLPHATTRRAMEAALRLAARQRPQSVDDWLRLLDDGPAATIVAAPIARAASSAAVAASSAAVAASSAAVAASGAAVAASGAGIVRAPRFHAALTGHAGKVRAVAWAPDGRSLAAACDHRALWLWDMEAVADVAGQGARLSRRAGARLLAAHADWVRALAFSPDGATLVSAGSDKTVCFWALHEASGPALRARVEGEAGEIGALAWAETVVAAGGRDGRVRLGIGGADWDVVEPGGGWIRALAASKDAQWLACGGDDGVVRVWRARDDRAASGNQAADAGMQVADAGDQARAAEWEWGGGIEAHAGGVAGLDFGGQGAAGGGVLMASAGGRDSAVKVWAVGAQSGGAGASLELKRTLTEARGGATSVAWSPDERVLAGGSVDKNVRLWDAATGALIAVLPEHPAGVYSVAWSPDGRYLAAGSEREVWLWRV